MPLASTWRVLANLLLIGISGGFFIVPLHALVQQRSNPEHGARIIAANNIMNVLYMVVGALVAAVALFIYGLVPEFLLRFIVWMLIHLVYRLRVREFDAIPEDGPALIVCNHISFVDALSTAFSAPGSATNVRLPPRARRSWNRA